MEATTQDNPTKITIEHNVVKLDQVIQFFVNAYKFHEGQINSHDYWIDTSKKEVVLRFFIETPPNHNQPNNQE